MEKIFELFLGFCCMFGFGMISIVVFSAISNGVDRFKRWRKERKEKKPLPEPLATLVAVDDDVDKYYICIKCPKYGRHFTRLLSYLDVSEYAARCRAEEGK